MGYRRGEVGSRSERFARQIINSASRDAAFPSDAYALLGLRAGWDFADGLSVFAEGRNLTDRRYISSASVAPVATPASALFEPGFGRSVYAGVQYRF